MASEKHIQEFIHRLEEGGWAKWIRLTALVTVVLGLYTIFIFDPMYWGLFKGLAHPKAMEQAQIAKEIASGHGFSTKMIRPLALAQFKENKGAIPQDLMPDTYYAPLWPATLAPFLWSIKSRWIMTTRDFIYAGDRMVAGVATAFFLLSLLVNYLAVRRLFDHQLAVYTVGLMILCDLFWRFSISGLPQMLMLFLFSIAVYAMVRAVENRVEERSSTPWLIVASFFFGLLALTHGITIWAFAGALFFCGFYFRPSVRTLLIMVGIFLLVYTPWLVRNYNVSGSPFGVAGYSGLYQIRGSESSIMRDNLLTGSSPLLFRVKVQNGLSSQFGMLFELLGKSLVAPIFFISLMHLFKRPETAAVRWLILSMWVSSVFGMAVFSSDDEFSQLHANDLHVLFIPMFTAYGLAFLLVMWSRLEIDIPLLRKAFITFVFLMSALPFINTLTVRNQGVVQWPPYVPPYIAILRDWTTDQEIIASDMPWAVAWYADRKSLWLPMTLQEFIELNDYGALGGRIVGLYLTPMSGNKSLINDIVKGEYKEWAPFILRNVNAKDFPLRAATALPIDNQCIFYSDHDRWSDRMD